MTYYDRIEQKLKLRENDSKAANVDVVRSIRTLFFCCQQYWMRKCQYDALLSARDEMDYACISFSFKEYQVIIPLWEWYHDINNRKRISFDDQRIKKTLSQYGIQSSVIDEVIKSYMDSFNLVASTPTIATLTDRRNKYEEGYRMLVDNLEPKEKTIEESVESVLHPTFLQGIDEELELRDVEHDAALCMYVGDARRDLCGVGGMEHRRPSATKKRNILYFTEACTTESRILDKKIAEIIEGYKTNVKPEYDEAIKCGVEIPRVYI